MARFPLSVLAATLLLWSVPALAATIVIVRPSSPAPALTETLSRLHGELLSVGLEVKLVDGPATPGPGGMDARAWLERMAAERGASAVIDIIGDVAPVAVDVWLIDKTSGRLTVSRVAVEPNTPNASERLAIRALEVLRSSFLEIDLAARRRAGEPMVGSPSVTSSQEEATEPAGPPERFGLEVGGAALTSLDGVGPAILPMMRAGFAARPWLAVQITLAGLGSRPTVATPAGHARVAQQYGLVGGCLRLRPQQRLWPFFSLSAGVLRTAIDGQAESPKQGHAADRWSLLVEGSLGAGLRLYGRYYLSLAAHAQMAEPYVAIHFLDEVVATSGRPNLLLTLAAGAWL